MSLKSSGKIAWITIILILLTVTPSFFKIESASAQASSATPASVYYKFDVIAQLGQANLRSIGFSPSINKKGDVAFTGRIGPGIGNTAVFVGDGKLPPRNISPTGVFVNRFHSQAIQINDQSKAVAQFEEPVTVNDFVSVARLWDTASGVGLQNIATARLFARSSLFDFESIQSFPSINNLGQTVLIADFGQADLRFICNGTCLVTPDATGTKTGGFNIKTGNFDGGPVIADNGRIAAVEFDAASKPTLRLCEYTLTASCDEIAGAGSGFTQIGVFPGISDDGVAVAFIGDRGKGPGIFLSVETALGTRAIKRVIGENKGPKFRPELGFDDDSNPLYFQDIDLHNRVAVIHQELGTAGIEGDSFSVSFMGTPNAASRSNPVTSSAVTKNPFFFSKQRGIWTARVDVEKQLKFPNLLAYHTTGPLRVAQVGDVMGNVTSGQQIIDLNIHDGLARAGRDNLGIVRTERRGDHQVAFWAATAAQEMVMRGVHIDSDLDGLLDHWETDGIDINGDRSADLRLSGAGADPMKRDLFLEIDWITDQPVGDNPAHKHIPAPGVTKRLVDMFAAAPELSGAAHGFKDGGSPERIPRGIKLHIDAGVGFDSKGKKLSQNMGTALTRGGNKIGQNGDPNRHIDVVYIGKPKSINVAGVNATSFQEIKDQFFGNSSKGAREFAYHYVVLSDFHSFINNALDAPFTGFATPNPNFDEFKSATALPRANLKGSGIKIVSGTGAGQVRRIVLHSLQDMVIAPPWNTLPDGSSQFVLFEGSSGLAEVFYYNETSPTGPDFNSVPGNDFLTTLGLYDVNTYGSLGSQRMQWHTIAHELGHNLGLRHCGNNPYPTPCQGTPNAHQSLMSYAHQGRKGTGVSSYSSTGTAAFNEWANLKPDFPWANPNLGNTLGLGPAGMNPAEYESLHGPMDVTSPSVTINNPADGTLVTSGSTVVVDLTATDDDQVVQVDVSFDIDGDGNISGPGETIMAVSTSPDSYQAVFVGVFGPRGPRTIEASAVDPSDNTNLSATVTVTVPNTAPLAGDESYTVNSDDSLAVVGPGVLGNDTDLEGDLLVPVLVTPPGNGTLFLNPNGSFSYKPNAGSSGTDTFTYVANDGIVDSNLATVTITVNPSTGAPASATLPLLYPGPGFLVGENPGVPTAADLNRDGKLDMVTVNRSSSDVSVLISNGDGTFLPEQRLPVGFNHLLTKVVDMNNDTILDIVTSTFPTFGSSVVSVLLGNGDGTFQPQRQTSIGSSASLAIDDLNVDGVQDLATSDASNIVIMLGNRDGTFTTDRLIPITFNSRPNFLTTADLNGDNVADLVALTSNFPRGGSAYLGQVDGAGNWNGFGAEQTFIATKGPKDATALDFSGDGIPDILMANQFGFSSGPVVSVLLGIDDGTGTGTGGFGSELFFTIGNAPVQGAIPQLPKIVDLNSDTFLDLVAADFGNADVSVLLGTGNPSTIFQANQRFSTGFSPFDLVVAELTGDGIPDIATVNPNPRTDISSDHTDGVSLLVGNGNGTFQPRQGLAAGAGGHTHLEIGAADFDGDGVDDLMIPVIEGSTAPDKVVVLFADGVGGFPNRLGAFGVGFSLTPPAIADLNGDGINDIVTANGAGLFDNTDISVILGNGDGTFGGEQRFPTGGIQSRTPAVADLNRDNIPDVVVANRLSNSITVLLGNDDGTSKGDGTFTALPPFPVVGNPEAVAVADLDGNGILDVVTANGVVSVLLGNDDGTGKWNGTFQPLQSFAVGTFPWSVAIADINGDTNLDLVTANFISADVSLLFGNGDGTFQPQMTIPANTGAAGVNPVWVAVGDLNGDSVSDIVTANSAGSGLGLSDDISVFLGIADSTGNPTGTFQPEQRYQAGNLVKSVSIADLTGDSIPDLITANERSGDVSVFEGIGDGTLKPEQRFMVGGLSRGASVGTLNADGFPDIAVMSGNFDMMILPHTGKSGGPSGSVPPIADPAGPYQATEGTPFLLDGSASVDANGSVVLYEWDLDSDGQFNDASGSNPTVSFSEDGSLVVGLRVTDNEGDSDTNAALITVLNASPVVDAGQDQIGNEGDIISLASATFTDLGVLDTHSATVNWGDGSPVEAALVVQGSGSGSVAGPHVYGDNGLYTATICVMDDEGAETCNTLEITINNVAPVVGAGNDQTVEVGQLVGLDPAAFTDPGILDAHTSNIDWGDGTVEPGIVFQGQGLGEVSGVHAYGAPNIYALQVCVIDDDLGQGCDTIAVEVQPVVPNQAPTVLVGPDVSALEGELQGYPFFFTDVNVNDVHTARVDWGDGSPVEPVALADQGPIGSGIPRHAYNNRGDYSPQVCVTDGGGLTGCDQLAVTVNTPIVAPRQFKLEALSVMQPHQDAKDAFEIAIDLVKSGLESDSWIDDFHVGPDGGSFVFWSERRAASELQVMLDFHGSNLPVDLIAAANQAISALVEADQVLADTQVQEALAGPTAGPDLQVEIDDLLTEAQNAFAEGVTQKGLGNSTLAIDGFWNAWTSATRAIELQNSP